jgi:hypothetical protein
LYANAKRIPVETIQGMEERKWGRAVERRNSIIFDTM